MLECGLHDGKEEKGPVAISGCAVGVGKGRVLGECCRLRMRDLLDC